MGRDQCRHLVVGLDMVHRPMTCGPWKRRCWSMCAETVLLSRCWILGMRMARRHVVELFEIYRAGIVPRGLLAWIFALVLSQCTRPGCHVAEMCP